MSEIKNKEKKPKTLFDKVWEKHVITGEPEKHNFCILICT